MATVYNKSFTKTDGTLRNMKFVRLNELTATDYSTFGIPTTTGESARTLGPGQETVWDIEKRSYRVFNWNTEQK
jgi:hypothetical protein